MIDSNFWKKQWRNISLQLIRPFLLLNPRWKMLNNLYFLIPYSGVLLFSTFFSFFSFFFRILENHLNNTWTCQLVGSFNSISIYPPRSKKLYEGWNTKHAFRAITSNWNYSDPGISIIGRYRRTFLNHLWFLK